MPPPPLPPFPGFDEPITLGVRDVAVRRAGQIVVAGVDFTLAGGRGMALRGPNGAGKSSLLLALTGLIGLETGRVDWRRAEADAPVREVIHFVGHLPGIKPALTVMENLRFAAALQGGDRALIEPAIDAAGLARLVGLEAGILSAGQVRRLALARLLVAPRPVWLLDEPTSALDAQGSDWVSALIAGQLDRGGMVLYATHLDLPVEADPRFSTLTLRPIVPAAFDQGEP